MILLRCRDGYENVTLCIEYDINMINYTAFCSRYFRRLKLKLKNVAEFSS